MKSSASRRLFVSGAMVVFCGCLLLLQISCAPTQACGDHDYPSVRMQFNVSSLRQAADDRQNLPSDKMSRLRYQNNIPTVSARWGIDDSVEIIIYNDTNEIYDITQVIVAARDTLVPRNSAFAVRPGENYRLKISIISNPDAEAGRSIFSSSVLFIEANSGHGFARITIY